MEANEVMTGIDHFFQNLLPKAYVSAEWDEDSIINAFHWAEYCEKIHKNYEDKPSKNKLDELIHSNDLKFNDVNMCFEDLKKCSNMLCEAFFENPSVENYHIKTVLIKVKNDISCFENIEKGPALDSLCMELLDALKPIKIVNSDRSLFLETKAEVYLYALKNATQYMTSEDQVEKYLSSSLEELCNSQDQMVFLHALMAKLPEEMSSATAIQEFAISWLMYNAISEENRGLFQFIWKHPSHLRIVSLNNREFLSFYLDFLTKCSSSLTWELQGDETVWTSRYGGRKTLTFEQILNHFRCLLRYDDEVGDFTKSHLLNLLNRQPGLIIWKEIYSRVT